MASLVTNRGKYHLLRQLRAVAAETNYYIALGTNTTPPTVDTNTMADVSEIAAGTGYTSGGISLTPGATDFDTYTENDTSDYAFVQLKDIVWTASGGSIPTSGLGARWAFLTDDNGTVSAREIYVAWDLVSEVSVSDGQTLTLQDCEWRLT